ncbi:SsgA family sporulation/cell division regulator [Nonomuraea sp. PA05]|uniref:SsgA family sporulation/cell division regulator n=1 Tax=Nonomuraea sp. PA05 TaxID=2604466 RepID=UPI0011D61FF4|nr:SsgA family sporulation/cell division regulator [Nonomuraea sp. PA05]TYB69775.1 SsgA family sporulation/cell division regulator [Nonomuraea sp. PA05]
MTSATDFVHQPFTLWGTGDQIEVHAAFLAYGKDCPNTVEVVFTRHDGSDSCSSYLVARAVLAAGLVRPASDGTFTVGPHARPDWLIVTLPMGEQARGYYADAVVLRAFLDATAQLVPMEVAA